MIGIITEHNVQEALHRFVAALFSQQFFPLFFLSCSAATYQYRCNAKSQKSCHVV